MYCSDSWHLATPLIQKQVARLQSDLSASKESIKELLAILEPTDHPYGIINMYHRCKAHEHLLPKAKEKLDHAKAILDKQ